MALEISWEILFGAASILGTIVASWFSLGTRMTRLETLIETKQRGDDARDMRLASLETRIDVQGKDLAVLRERLERHGHA